MVYDKCAKSFYRQKDSKSASHTPSLIFIRTWISHTQKATRTNVLGDLDSVYLKKDSTIYGKKSAL